MLRILKNAQCLSFLVKVILYLSNWHYQHAPVIRVSILKSNAYNPHSHSENHNIINLINVFHFIICMQYKIPFLKIFQKYLTFLQNFRFF